MEFHDRKNKAITAIEKALAQTQEPWCMKMNGCKTKCEDCPDEPPQRTWVGLTDEEIDSYFEDHGWSPSKDYYPVIKAIEAKLKQKNGYAEENT
jgi:hypothetical protein